jgi:hypothetical protein
MNPEDEEYEIKVDWKYKHKLNRWVDEGFTPMNSKHMLYELMDENDDLRRKIQSMVYEMQQDQEELSELRKYKREKEKKEEELKKKFALLQLD